PSASLGTEAARCNSQERSIAAVIIPRPVRSDRCSDSSPAYSSRECVLVVISGAVFVSEKIRSGSISKATHRRALAIQSHRAARVAPLQNRHQAAGEKRLQERCVDISRDDVTGRATSTPHNHACTVTRKVAWPFPSVMSTHTRKYNLDIQGI